MKISSACNSRESAESFNFAKHQSPQFAAEIFKNTKKQQDLSNLASEEYLHLTCIDLELFLQQSFVKLFAAQQPSNEGVIPTHTTGEKLYVTFITKIQAYISLKIQKRQTGARQGVVYIAFLWIILGHMGHVPCARTC